MLTILYGSTRSLRILSPRNGESSPNGVLAVPNYPVTYEQKTRASVPNCTLAAYSVIWSPEGTCPARNLAI